MNTLRRISRPLVKTFAVGAVMVAAALPAMAITGTASASTTAPTMSARTRPHSLVRRARMATPSWPQDSQAISFWKNCLLLTRPSARGNAHHDSSWRHLHELRDERERAHGKHLYDLRDDFPASTRSP